jgi:hypothetical protein
MDRGSVWNEDAMVTSEQLHVALSYHGREFFVGGASLHCEPGDSPHAWALVLRLSEEETEDFAELKRRQATVHVSVRAEVHRTALVEETESRGADATHVRLTGMGFCPLPDHDFART